MASLLNQGLTDIRDAAKSAVTHVGVSSDDTAHNATQTSLNPGGGVNLIKVATKTDVDFRTFDATLEIDGDTEFTNQTVWTIGLLSGATASDAISRTVRTQGIGVQEGDTFTIGIRARVEDTSS